jgi:hypothetical protein
LFFSVLSSFGSSLLLPSNLTSITKVVLNHVFSILSLICSFRLVSISNCSCFCIYYCRLHNLMMDISIFVNSTFYYI